MELVTKHNGDALKVRREDDLFASADKATANIDYIAMMEGIDLYEGETVEGDDEDV